MTGKKERLLKIFGGWCDNVVDLLLATEEDAILRRDIYDRTPTFTWGKGNVTLLGDSVHAMQPNLGQGGCMAIEVCFTVYPILTQYCASLKSSYEDYFFRFLLVFLSSADIYFFFCTNFGLDCTLCTRHMLFS